MIDGIISQGWGVRWVSVRGGHGGYRWVLQ